MSDPNPKPVAASRLSISRLMLPEHANPLGNVHGGAVLKLVDEAGALCAMRHSRRPCVTVAVDSVTFLSPVRVGELVSCDAEVHFVGVSSIEVGVRVRAENPLTGETTHTNTARLVYVALDGDGQPTSVPGLLLETDDERQRWDAALERYQATREQHRRGSPTSR